MNKYSNIYLIFAIFLSQPVNAELTDIANAPLFTSSVSNVKSNLMFIFDDSGSMDSDYLPDDAPRQSNAIYGYYTSQCNGVAYNPLTVYKPPIKADKTSYPNSSFSSAKVNGFSSSSPTLNLNGSYYYTYNGTQPPMSYSYNSSGVIKTSTFYTECFKAEGTDAAKFSKISLSSTSSQAQNYANWFSYYSNRMLMMKTSVGFAFSTVDSKYRVGFNVISNKSSSGTGFLDISDFNSTHTQSFYDKLYAVESVNATPLRGALSRAGQYFGNMSPGQTVDPIQYSCQKNFSILSTDGYWNTNNEVTTGTKYGPYQLDNITLVGQQDGAGTLRPMYDGNTSKVTTTQKWNSTDVRVATVTTPSTSVSMSSQTTTTSNPVKSWKSNLYSLGHLSRNNSSITRCSSNDFSNDGYCLITVKTSGSHAYQTGDSITVSGALPSSYNGNFTIQRKDSDEYYYTLSSRPGNDTAVGKSSSEGSCPAGQGTLSTLPIIRDELSGTAVTSDTITTTNSIKTVITTTNSVTPYTRVIVVVDGITVSDSTSAGSTSSSNSSTTSTSTSAPVVTSKTTTANGVITYTPWVNSSASIKSCASSLPSPNPSTPVNGGAASSSGPVVVVSPTIASGPIASSASPTSLTDGPTTTTSAVVSTTSTVNSGGSSNTLADVAMYYYKTDLRTPSLSNCTGSGGGNVCENNVAGGGRDVATYQHMTTYTLGLGSGGTLKYDSKYLTQKSGDFFDISQGAKNWTVPDGGAENIDDLWHAAVNGRGQYFSAAESTALSAGLNSALDAIKSISGTASAAATSSLQPVQGNNDIFVAKFTSVKWTGDVISYKIDPSTGVISNTPTWSAQAMLDGKTPSTRKIYYPKSGTLKTFGHANLTADGFGGYFDNFCNKPGSSGAITSTQCNTLSASDKAIANSGANLVDYLRGNQNYTVFRTRDNVLGDIINASPLFIGKPAFRYTENSYASFASASTRSDVIYAAANDGMLHAFDRTTGSEKWAFIPSFVMPNMYKLADTDYANNHSFFVDGSPVAADIYTSTGWKSIIIGGLNAGGRGYYALDVTDADTPKILWEFSEADLGLTFSNPVIAKKSDGTWVVLFASGYNNVSPGDGNGYLYVLNAATGAQISKIPTLNSGLAVGSTTTPSGLSKINAYITSDTNNIAEVVYAGDLLGNLWRFDISSTTKPYLSSLKLAELKIGGVPQPITTKPALAEVSYNGVKYSNIYIGTGKYLGLSDLTSTGIQTIYAIKDKRLETGLGDIRSGTGMVIQEANTATSVSQGKIIQGTAKPVDWSSKNGWYLDFISPRERVSINPHIVLNTLYIGTNVPSSDACTVGGTSWLYKLNIESGAPLNNSSEKSIGVSLGNVMVMGMTTVQLEAAGGAGAGSVVTIVTRSDGTLGSVTGAQPSKAGVLKRTSWRVLK